MGAAEGGVSLEGHDEIALARRALAEAELLRAAAGAADPSPVLYAAALRLLLQAELARQGEPREPETFDALWARYVTVPALAALSADSDSGELELVRSSLAPAGERFLARLPPARAVEARELLRRLAFALATPLSKASRVAFRRVTLRRSAAAAFALLVLAVAAGWLVRSRTSPNLALEARVELPHADAGYDPTWVVDGNRNNLGFHSSAPPYTLTLDLGTQKQVRKAVVYNRMDCCQERAVPIELWVHRHGQFEKLAERTAIFDIWRPEFSPVTTRYVRLVSRNSLPFHLAEVELY